MSKNIEELVGDLLRKHKLNLATAESCTGGLIGHLLTNVPGSSDYYLGGAQVYSNDIKHKMLGVRLETLETYGAVSAETVVEMACGVRNALNSDIGLSVSGIAGPGGGTIEKPVGLVWIGIAASGFEGAWENNWDGNRSQIKEQAAIQALNLLSNYLEGKESVNGDRKRPHDSLCSGDPIKVWVSFEENGEIKPTGFSSSGVKYQVDTVGRQWEEDGCRHFLVMVPIDKIYELIFNRQEMRWYLRSPKQPGFMA
jgi:PncC family amidohydrolase